VTKPLFTWPIRVYYEDTDATGVVYHANYLRYFERARTEWLRALGVSQQSLRAESGVVFTLANLEVDYLLPARLDDELLVTVAVEHLRRASLTFSQTVQTGGGAGALLARARARVGCVDQNSFRPCPLPDDFVQKVSNGVSV
jgi:acyl-CoA thioester hydrolase